MEPETMNEENNSNNNTLLAERSLSALKVKHPMDALLKKGFSPALKRAGELAEGTVIAKKGSRMFVDLGPAGTGIVYGREFYAAQDILKDLGPGDTVSAKIIDPDNEEGYVELSLKEAGEEKRWLDLKRLMESGEVLELPVKEANRGGLIIELKGIQGFLPASQLSSSHYPRVEGGEKEKIYQELQKLAGETLRLKVIDVDPKETKLIFSEKESESKAMAEKLSKYKAGDIVEGEITGVLDFGAFLKFEEGLEGLVHISEIDWSLIEDPRHILKVGERHRAKVIDVQGGKVSLSLKQLKEDPWLKLSDKHRKGGLVHGVVTKHNPFGAFVQVEPEIQGLVHISEFGRVERMREELELGRAYDFKVLLLDAKDHRMSLGVVREKPDSEIRSQ